MEIGDSISDIEPVSGSLEGVDDEQVIPNNETVVPKQPPPERGAVETDSLVLLANETTLVSKPIVVGDI